ncbi:MAG: hypothetical protein CMK59_05180 [Proteobacteria bacterium]|nr:hypothetical protein [Pseudomonadota bacterium]
MLFYIFLACTKAPTETSAPEQAASTQEAPAPQPAEAEQANSFEDFGSPFTLDEIIPASQLLNAPTEYVGKNIRIEGKVSDVCQKMGCWLVISDENKHMRITTKNHGFFVNKQGAGSQCEIEGEVISREIDPDRTAHFESESADGAPIPEKEATENIVYEIVASSIRFYNKEEAEQATE